MSILLRGKSEAERPGPSRSFGFRWASWFDLIVRHPIAVLGSATVSALLCGLVLNPRGLALAGGLASVMALGVCWPWISLRGIRGSVSFEQTRGREGQAIASRLDLRNRAPWGAFGLAVRFGKPGDGEASPLAVANVGGWSRRGVDWTFVPDRRGEHPVGGARIATGFPFGLRQSSRPLEVDRPILVWPRTFPVGPIPDEAGGEASEGSTWRDRPGDSGDLLGVRSYRRGDPLRRVHWGQTARHGELIVCELQSASAPRVQIVLDLDPAAHVGVGPDGSLEWSIRVAASLLDDWIGQGADAELVIGDRVIRGRGGTVSNRRSTVLDAIARLEPEGEPPLGEVLDGPQCRRFRRGLRVVVCTDRARAGSTRSPGAVTERFAVLSSTAFEDGGSSEDSVDPGWVIRPWILIDDPSRVPQQVRRWQKGVGHVR